MPSSTDAAIPIANVSACLQHLARTLAIAHGLLRAERQVDLTGLDAEIGFVCAQALNLPPADGRAVRPVLIDLREQVDLLHQALDATRRRRSG